MPRILSCLLAACLTAASAQAQAPAKQASTTTESGAKVDDVIQAMRLDLQSARADILAKNMSLTADQAAKFWPVFNAYQKEQNEIIEAQLRDIKKYVESYDTLSDAGATRGRASDGLPHRDGGQLLDPLRGRPPGRAPPG